MSRAEISDASETGGAEAQKNRLLTAAIGFGWLPLPVLSRFGVPSLTTMHGRLDLPGLSYVIGTFADAPRLPQKPGRTWPFWGG